MGLNMKEKQAVTREYKTPYQKATKKKAPCSKRAKDWRGANTFAEGMEG
jgi:hypothetical protein